MFRTFLEQPQWVFFLLSALVLVLAVFMTAKRRRARNWAYVVGAIMPLAWLAAPLLAGGLVRGVVRPEIAWCQAWAWSCYLDEMIRVFNRLSGFNPFWYMAPLTFLLLLFLLFLRKGVIAKTADQPDGDPAANEREPKLEDNITYELVFKYRMLMWATFALYLLMLAWLIPSAFLTTKANFLAVHANLGDVSEAIDDMVYDAGRLERLTTLKGRWALAGLAQQNTALLETLKQTEASLVANETALAASAAVAEGEIAPTYEFGGDTLPNLLAAIRQMQSLVGDLDKQIGAAEKALEKGFDEPQDDLAMAWRINEIQDKVRALTTAAAGISFEFVTPFLMVALLFLVFLLLPWLQYISFILRKREEIVPDRVELLQDSGLSSRLLASLEVSNDPALLSIAGALKKTDAGQINKQDSRTAELYVQHVERYQDSENLEQEQADYEAVKKVADGEAIKKQTFYSREYLVPLLILSALTLVGWYYIIFPRTMNGLVDLLESGAGVAALTDHLTQFTPLTMAFAGAWLFMTVMLTYRWVNNDLYPRTYFYAAMRLVYGILVGLVFIALTRAAADPTAQAMILALAFFVGAFPLEYVRALWQWLRTAGDDNSQAAQVIHFFEVPDWGSRQPLTTLEGMTIWDDTRFYQEGMQNVHALATADMLRLAMRTPYSAQKLIDWVDQAILRIHTKTLWHAGMSAITIRRASSLIDSCSDPKTKERSADKIKGVVESFNAAQMMSLGADSPRVKAYDKAAEMEKTAADLAAQTAKVKEANTALTPGDEAARDNIVKLRSAVDGLAAKTAVAQTARTAVAKMLGDEPGQWAAGAALAKQIVGLTEGSPTLLREAADALAADKISSKKLEAAEEGIGDKLTTAKNAVQKIAQQLCPDGEDDCKKLAEKALAAVPAAGETDEAKKAAGAKAGMLAVTFVALLDAAAGAKAKGESLTSESAEAAKAAVGQMSSAAAEMQQAAQALQEAAAAGSTAKSQAQALQTKLGTGDGNLAKLIETAQSSTAGDLGDGSKIAAAKAAIKGAVDLVGLAYEADSVAALVQKLAQEAALREYMARSTAETAKTKIDDLAAAVKSANDLAQSIKADDATTWDNVKGLGKLANDLPPKITALEKVRKELDAELDGLTTQETLALREAVKQVQALSTAEAQQAAESARDLLATEAEDGTLSYKLTSEKYDGLDEAKGKVSTAVTKAESLVTAANETAAEAMRTALPLRLTEGILQIMLDSLQKAPNIHYVCRFWEAQQKKALADTMS